MARKPNTQENAPWQHGPITLVITPTEDETHVDVALSIDGNEALPSGVGVPDFDVYWTGEGAKSLAVELVDQLQKKIVEANPKKG